MKILIEKAVIEQVLESLGGYDSDFNIKHYDLITALRKALAEQAEQKPVAWKDLTYGNLHHQDFGNSTPLYAAPVRTKDLTDDEILEADNRSHGNTEWTKKKAFARAVIAADRKLNKQTKENQE